MKRRPDLRSVARQWWPVPTAVGGSLVAQKLLLESRYDVSGHAAEHLAGATAPFMATAMVAILLWATPAAARRPEILLACAAWWSATVLVLVGNLRVVDALVDAGLDHVPTGQVPDVADHGLANLAPWLAVAAVLVLVAVLWRRRLVSTRAAVAAAALSVVVPPWILPGAGIVILVVARCLARARDRAVAGGHVEGGLTPAA